MPAVKNFTNMGKKRKTVSKPKTSKQDEEWVDASSEDEVENDPNDDDVDQDDAESDLDDDDDDVASELNSSEYEALDRDVDSDEEEDEEEDKDNDDGASDISLESVDDEEEPAKVLEKLKDKDPEFYQFLLENDKELLEGQDDEDEEDGMEGDDGEAESGMESDEEDRRMVKAAQPKGEKIKVTPAVVQKWASKLETDPTVEQISHHVYALKAAVDSIVDDKEKGSNTSYIIVGNDTFNALINSCFVDLLPAIHKHLKLPPPTSKSTTSDTGLHFDPTKSKKWKGFISIMKCYLIQTLKIVDAIVDPSMKTSLLRHILYLIPFYVKYRALMKRLLLTSMTLWSEYDNDKARVLSFLCILRILRNQPAPAQNYILKKLHMAYVKNCKLITKESLPNIAFMRQSLVELYSLDQEIAYQHCFVYLRQLAIGLRTAMTIKKQESLRAVYCWPYVQSILLWAQLLSCLTPSDVLKPLIYPLVQVALGTIKLIPVPKYFPLRFHLAKALIKLSSSTKVFVPILPLLTDVLDQIQYNKMKSRKKPVENVKKLRPLDLDLYLRVSRDMIHEKRYIETVVNRCHDLMLEYMTSQSHKIAFPELTFVAVTKLKGFVKSCPVAHHVKLIKDLVVKTEETSNLITNKRKTVTFGISDVQAVESWEASIRDGETPLMKYQASWKKIREEEEKEWEKQDEEIKKTKERDIEDELQSESDQEASEKVGKKDQKKRPLSKKGKEKDEKDNEKRKRKKKRPSQNLRKRLKQEKTAHANMEIPNAALEVSSDED